uniref:Uncharacterized protein n=1 Tax=Chromera velia CCMP2878 TaxID=1169474 RepID=A0A0G4I2U7_9ALVE|mmetsp:Transcript_4555/g.9142  ORF Transcript_4555/g.9142 Transcript_4555/m.9142 type:complete len:200 (+) Transcript_4555:200-799(+)|eukprot:Cvel_10492.t1-p1 / transcript=Cvel_10492.t1 / gene=Cvel_10492 / organism=Chromera_velia_CCMP2878 / gene_product=hypothetical protein / transcript_product=hypothetical protein / location=Cvel_scaffold634:22810-25348(+) / protein_length=199 / sequence_SO=supercontig / SO=protein_coding / is_pseudo=false
MSAHTQQPQSRTSLLFILSIATALFSPASSFSLSSFVPSSSLSSRVRAHNTPSRQARRSTPRRPEPFVLEARVGSEASEGVPLGESGVSLEPLQNWEEVASYLGDTVKDWLDEEWIEQYDHVRVGNFVKEYYVRFRSEGVSDLMTMLFCIGEEFMNEDLGECFVDGWTIANKVSELLISRLEEEQAQDAAAASSSSPAA